MTMEQTNSVKKISNKENERQTLLKITDLIKNIKYGYIQITIQDGRVVQIDKTEKFRLYGQMSK